MPFAARPSPSLLLSIACHRGQCLLAQAAGQLSQPLRLARLGYSHGHCFETLVVRDVIVEVPVVVESLPQLVPGTTIVVAGQNLGLENGQVLVQVGGIALPAEIVGWEVDKVTVVLPMVALMAPTKAELMVLRADGSMARRMAFEFVAGVMQQQ